MRSALLLLALLATGCINYVTSECRDCRILNARASDGPQRVPRIKKTTKRLFIIVPGALGYSWEWNPAVKRLKEAPDTEFVVFWWEPLGSIRRAARDMARWVNDVTTELEPRELTEVTIVAHSMAGIVAAYAAPELIPPNGVHVKIATIGTAFAGMIGPDFGYPDNADFWLSLFASFSPWVRYPTPAEGLEIVEYRTTWPEDPVMEPRFGHDPAPASIGPRPRRRVQLPHMDHNKCVDLVVDRLIRGVD